MATVKSLLLSMPPHALLVIESNRQKDNTDETREELLTLRYQSEHCSRYQIQSTRRGV